MADSANRTTRAYSHQNGGVAIIRILEFDNMEIILSQLQNLSSPNQN